jgi:DinB family protein
MKRCWMGIAVVMCAGLVTLTLHGQAPMHPMPPPDQGGAVVQPGPGMQGMAMQAAAPPTMSAGIKTGYNQVKMNLLKAADAMPEDGYSSKPSPAERDFGGWVAHVADAQTGTCSRVAGTPKNINAASKTSKADLVAALKDSFDTCDAVYNALTDSNAGDLIAGGRGPGVRLTLLAGNTAHDNECYGSMAVYLRLKGIVPPSSEGRGMAPPAGGMGGGMGGNR